ncbi:NADH dehydrogenase [ubiquinone] 1 beta subcomplex subunit 1 [Varanus komodoensis]|nr:NADH dehydrogenase [ubiquinone] 1 beta subcomplex subunit 1 [Varanus komodoensis]
MISLCFIDYSKASDCVDHKRHLKEMRVPEHLSILMCNLYHEQETTVTIDYGETVWFPLDKDVRQRYVDDTVLLRESNNDLKQLLMKVKEERKRQMKTKKTKIMTIEVFQNFSVNKEETETVKDFTYLSSIINSKGDCSQEIQRLRLEIATMKEQIKVIKLTMVNIIQLVRDHWPMTLVPLGFVLGIYFDRVNDEKLALFKNKSKLYQRELKPGEEAWK